MFTWICPKCGTEVPPSYDDCPNCTGKLKPSPEAAATPPKIVEPPPFAGMTQPPPATQPRPAEPPPQVPYHHHDHGRTAIPGWLVTILVAVGLIAVVGGGLYLYNQRKAAPPQTAAAEATLPGRAESTPVKAHPYAKYLEITGLRISEDSKQKAQVSVVVINHSGAELPPLEIEVNLKAMAKNDAEPVAGFRFQLPSMAPYSSKDVTAPMKTKMRAYELPDWQFLKAEFQILTPAQ